MKLIIGSHVSFEKQEQLIGSVKEAISYGANTFMFYTGAPQNTNRVEISDDKTNNALLLMKENNIDINNIIVHAPYIINLANNTNSDFAISFLKEEINRCERLGITKLVLHPGSHVKLGEEIGIKNIIYALNQAIKKDSKVSICIETMAGKGSECGYKFEQIREIIDGVKYNDHILVCMDTCHMNDAGYDISDFDKLLDDVYRIIGIVKLACIHINDSKNELGMKKDRHANIGYGSIGFNTLINIIYNKRLDNIPKILETPYIKTEDGEYPPYKFEIEMILNKKFDEKLIEKIIKYYENI
jgi:deoxyribonuclease-4